MSSDDAARIIVDPSLLLQDPALDWLETAPDLFVVSESFRQQLSDVRIAPTSPLLPPGQPYAAEHNRDRALSFIELAGVYSFKNDDLEGLQGEVTRLLMEGDDAAQVYCDEWVYLQSHSIMFSAVRHPLDAFRRAGARVEEFGRRVLEEFVNVVIPQEHQDRYSARTIIIRGGVKWVVIGAATAVGGAIGGPGGALVPLPGIPIARAFDP